MSHSDDVSLSTRSVPETGTSPHPQGLEGQLQAAEATAVQAQRLFMHAPTPMLLVNPVGYIVNANQKAGTLLGLTPDRLTGRRLEQFMDPASHSALTLLLKSVFGQAGSHHVELVLFTQDSDIRTIRIDATQDGVDAGLASWAHLVLTDITDLKDGHSQLLDRAEVLQAQVQEQAARRHHVEGEVQDIIRATQTQVNLQLSRIQNLLKRQVKAAGPSSDLTLAQEALRGTVGLLASLDGYMQARQLRVRMRSVDLNQVLREVKSDLAGELRDRVVEWSPAPLPTVYGDSRALRMILTAYLSNALKFTRAREVAQIRFVIEEHDHEVVIGVQDNGVGFSNRVKEKAFKLFGRLHSAGEYEGAGVDLAAVRQVCALMGGRAWGEGKVDQGATFWFACPKARPAPV